MSEFSLSGRVKYLKRQTQSSRSLSLRDILYLVILFFLPTQLGKHFWPSFSYVAGIGVDYLSPTFYLTDILLVILFVFVCRDLLVKKKIIVLLLIARSYFLRNPFVFTGIIALVAGATLAPSPLLSYYGLFRIGEIAFFALCTKQFLERSPSHLWQFSVVLLAVLFFESSLAIVQFLVQHSIGGIFYLFGERRMNPDAPGAALASLNGRLILRPYGTFSHPNVLSGFILVVGSIIGSISLLKKNSRIFRIVVFVTLSIAVVALFLTLSRVSIIILICLILLHGFLDAKLKLTHLFSFSRNGLRRTRGFLQYLLMFVVFIIFIFLISPLLFDRFASPDFFGEAYQERLILAIAALEMASEHPFYGVGIGQFIPSLPLYLPFVHFSLLQPVHNIFILFLAETGILGFAGAVAVLIAGIKKIYIKGMSIVITPLVLCLLLGISDHYVLTQQQGRLLLGLAFGMIVVDPKKFVRRLMKNTKKD